VIILLMICSCAPPKAYLDQTYRGQILWPGPPEKPRISYLWSITQVAATAEGRRSLSDFLSGDVTGDVTDPRSSNVFLRPSAVYVDSADRLYVADPAALRVNVIDLKTHEVMTIAETKEEELRSPVGVVADAEGRIYVSDSILKKVLVFDKKGAYLSQFEGDFQRPTSLAIDLIRREVYVADTADNKIYRYTTGGKRISGFGTHGFAAGELYYPSHLFVDKEGLLYVNDAMNSRVQIFTPEGTFLRTIGRRGTGRGDLDKPKGIAVDRHGNVYVADSLQDTVKIFDKQGDLLLFFGEKGQNPGQFWLPSGIFVDAKDIIYVADTYNMRIQAFQFLGEDSGAGKEKK
jgi:DNA-binding beta-propeller fold protein YncE